MRGLEGVGGLVVRTRIEQGHSYNSLKHQVEGSHVVSILYEGPSEVVVSATAHIDPPIVPAHSEDGFAEDHVEENLEPDAAFVEAERIELVENLDTEEYVPPRRLRTLVYRDLNSRRWDLGTFQLGSHSKRGPYEFVLHRSEEGCRGGREHVVLLQVRARALWPAQAEEGAELPFVVRCRPGA